MTYIKEDGLQDDAYIALTATFNSVYVNLLWNSSQMVWHFWRASCLQWYILCVLRLCQSGYSIYPALQGLPVTYVLPMIRLQSVKMDLLMNQLSI